jgi:hypothetical protein
MGNYIDDTQSSSLTVTSTLISTRLNNNIVSGNITGGAGSFDIQKTSSTVTTIYKNGSSVATGNSGGTLPNSSDGIYLGVLNYLNNPLNPTYVNSEFRFAYFSEGLNSTEIANLRTRVQAYQTSLSRQL